MLISWNWLTSYVDPHQPHERVVERLMLSGLNDDGTSRVGNDVVLNLEVTSNRPDCLGHLGVAREVAVLFGVPLKLPAAAPAERGPAAETLASVRIDCPALCPRYTARVIRGVKIGPSPAWLAERLAAIGVATINNVVDITNYVLFECGQPLHAFDLARIAGRSIVVREARPGETFQAINHKEYTLAAGMCVIADGQRAVALAGVMGGADTEVDETTTDVLIESAAFSSMSVRATARKLNLHSDSSYRFERALDPAGVDWASRRACELILELAGGELATGVVDAGTAPAARELITLRLAQIPRILGIDVPAAEVRRILTALGNKEVSVDAERIEVVPPTWRSDLVREIDLIEEVARIYGYEKIPENEAVPLAASHRAPLDRVLGRVRSALTALGMDEAMTPSVVDQSTSEAFSPWTDAPPLVSATPLLRRADRLRRSLAPSLLEARGVNESLANPVIELFEIANVYLPASSPGALPNEQLTLALCSGGDFLALKGAVEAVVAAINPAARLSVRATSPALLDAHKSCELWISWEAEPESLLGFLGEVSAAGLKAFDLRSGATIAEANVHMLAQAARLVPTYCEPPIYPAVARDINLVVDEAVRWADIEGTLREAAGPMLEAATLTEVYRDRERLGPGKKSFLVALSLRSRESTLRNEEADRIRESVVEACRKAHGAALRV